MDKVDRLTLALAKKFTSDTAEEFGAVKGAPAMIESCVKQNGRNTVTFLWENSQGEQRRTQLVVLDGTPIYEWQSGDSYTYGDLVIYTSAFYRCITPNSDTTFDDTKWNEIGSPDGNYDIVQNSELLPPIFTSADRKLYYSIEDGFFWLWNGEEWEAQVDTEPVENGTGYVSSGALFAVKDALESSQAILSSVVNTNVARIQSLESGQTVLTSVVNSNVARIQGLESGQAVLASTVNSNVTKIQGLESGQAVLTSVTNIHTQNITALQSGKVDKVDGKGLSTNDYTNADKIIVDGVETALSGKVDKVTGKGLSTNDYTDTDKAIVDGMEPALAGKVDKVDGKGLSANDYTNADKTIVDGVTTALAGKISTSEKGTANGVAELDENGKVPSAQLPSYVDDVLEFASVSAFPAAGESGKIYIALDTNKTYRWSGTGYIEISESLALGETSSTAYAGNKGKANADAITAIKDGSSIDSFGDVETALSGKVDKVSGKGLSTNDYTTTEKNKLADIATGAEVNVQSDWSQSTTTADDYIKNKPTLGTAAAKGVSDSSSASAFSSSGTNVTTERDVYYGTPKINNSKSYTSDTNIYAPTGGGTSGQYLKANGSTSTPTWQSADTTPTANSTKLVTSGGVKTAINAIKPVYIAYPNAGSHNAIYRGKNLGSSVTSDQWSAISAGTFDDLYIGDYWKINDVTWTIAAFNYWKNVGDTWGMNYNHVVIVPSRPLYDAKMNDSDITTGGYVESKMHTTYLEDAKTQIQNAFGSTHILSHRELFTKAVSEDKASAYGWYDSTVDLMNEIMIFGHGIQVRDSKFEIGIDKIQLPLFAFAPYVIYSYSEWWLRTVGSSNSFVIFYRDGFPSTTYSSRSLGVIPVFGIRGLY